MVKINFLFLFCFQSLFTSILCSNQKQHSLTWPHGTNSPYNKIEFTYTSCHCSSSLNETTNGCLNITSGLITEQKCIDKPYWGIIFVWWGFAAFLIGGVTTTSFGIISDIYKTIKIYGFNSRSNPSMNQVVDINHKNDPKVDTNS